MFIAKVSNSRLTFLGRYESGKGPVTESEVPAISPELLAIAITRAHPDSRPALPWQRFEHSERDYFRTNSKV